MKYNNKDIGGLYKYHPGYIYTPSDLVVFENSLYTPVSDTDKSPSEDPDSWKHWYQDDLASLDDYKALVEGIPVQNKIVTTGLLKSVINSYMKGISGTGIITEVASISEIYRDPEVNYGMFLVDRNDPEIIGMFPDTPVESYIILRQYTYNLDNQLHRLQELYDGQNALVYFRETNIYTGQETGWNLTTYNSISLAKQLSSLISEYSARLQYISELESHYQNNFRFSKIQITPGSDVSFTAPQLQTSFYFSITDSSEEINKNYQVFVNLSGGETTSRVFVTDDISLLLTVSDSGVCRAQLTPNSINIQITSIFYQEYGLLR